MAKCIYIVGLIDINNFIFFNFCGRLVIWLLFPEFQWNMFLWNHRVYYVSFMNIEAIWGHWRNSSIVRQTNWQFQKWIWLLTLCEHWIWHPSAGFMRGLVLLIFLIFYVVFFVLSSFLFAFLCSMLPVSLDCPLLIAFLFAFLCSMLHVSLDCPLLIATAVFSKVYLQNL